jgi:ADP-heptose:LPS heptosyltransferase
VSWKNALLRCLLRIAPVKKQLTDKPEKILVIATTALGDTLWATPGLDSIRRSFPRAYIAVLTSPIGLQILKGHPAIDQLHLWEKPVTLWRVLSQERFDTALIFHTSQRLPLPLVALSGVGRIVGTRGLNKGLDDLLTLALPHEREHEIVRRLRMVEAIGGKIREEGLSLHLEPKEELGPWEEGRWVAIHPGAKDHYKLWPASRFGEVGRTLQERMGCKVLITGTREERGLMEEVARQIPGSQLMEKGLSLREFAALLKKMELIICNDTGTFHLACALERPVIGIYSPTDPTLCGPYKAKRAQVLSQPPTCTPCLRRACRSPFCLLQITPDELIRAAVALLSEVPVN